VTSRFQLHVEKVDEGEHPSDSADHREPGAAMPELGASAAAVDGVRESFGL